VVLGHLLDRKGVKSVIKLIIIRHPVEAQGIYDGELVFNIKMIACL
jgi:hypothetical protein